MKKIFYDWEQIRPDTYVQMWIFILFIFGFIIFIFFYTEVFFDVIEYLRK